MGKGLLKTLGWVRARYLLHWSIQPKIVRYGIVVSFALATSGMWMNLLVRYANGGNMPVASQKEDFLYIDPRLGNINEVVPWAYPVNDSVYVPLTHESALPWLADRLYVINPDFSTVLPKGVLNYAEKNKVLLRGEQIVASIGDVVARAGCVGLGLGLVASMLFYFGLAMSIVRKKEKKA